MSNPFNYKKDIQNGVDYFIDDSGKITKGVLLGRYPHEFIDALNTNNLGSIGCSALPIIKKKDIQMIHSCDNMKKEILQLIDKQIESLEMEIEVEKEQVLSWFKNECTIKNEWKKEKLMERTMSIKPGYKEFILNKYIELRKIFIVYKKSKKSKGGVTDEQIQKAKQVPIDSIIEFNRGNKAHCLWHDERTESLSYKQEDNFAKCFGCGKGVDSIEAYMKVNNVDFIRAVKGLSNL